MFIRKTVGRYKDKTYTNYLVVETVTTPQGPRQRTLCSLGSLSPGPKSKWPGLIIEVEAALSGQISLEAQDSLVTEVAARVRNATRSQDVVAVHTDQLRQEEAQIAIVPHLRRQILHGQRAWQLGQLAPALALLHTVKAQPRRA